MKIYSKQIECCYECPSVQHGNDKIIGGCTLSGNEVNEFGKIYGFCPLPDAFDKDGNRRFSILLVNDIQGKPVL